MSSWQLFKHLTPFHASDLEYTPVFRRARQQTPIWQIVPLSPTIRQISVIALGLTVLVYLLALVFVTNPLTVYCLTNLFTLPVLLLSSLVIWSLPLGMTLAPVVVREREQDTWYTLRTTPFDTETLLLSKGRAALMRLRALLLVARGVMFLAAVIVSAISLNLVERLSQDYLATLPMLQACGTGIAVMALAALLFLLDRAQQFVLMIVAALAASASSTSMRLALPGASVAALLAWMVDVGIAELLIALDPGSMSLTAQGRLLIMFGPVAGYVGQLDPARAALYLALTFLLRELAVRLLWRWTVYAARV